MDVYDLAGAFTGALFLAACLQGMRWADQPRPGSSWSSSTYGDADATAAQWGPELSALDVLDHPSHYRP